MLLVVFGTEVAGIWYKAWRQAGVMDVLQLEGTVARDSNSGFSSGLPTAITGDLRVGPENL